MPEAIEGVSVIVPTRNAAPLLSNFFANLRQCEVLEVFLCDLGSEDDTLTLSRDAGVHILRGSSDIAEAANAAARQARGNVLWLLSPHCRPPP
ncbi:MAG: glycosyltransferase, partial [Planctomycetota bacterium]|nr:glycosyltransferase [Planctomycetota bacterium]